MEDIFQQRLLRISPSFVDRQLQEDGREVETLRVWSGRTHLLQNRLGNRDKFLWLISR